VFILPTAGTGKDKGGSVTGSSKPGLERVAAAPRGSSGWRLGQSRYYVWRRDDPDRDAMIAEERAKMEERAAGFRRKKGKKKGQK
jgi:hypothetical protein